MSETGLSGRRDRPGQSSRGERNGESHKDIKTREDQSQREDQERRSQARGLLFLALLVLLFALLRAGLPRVFTAGWWRLW